MDVSSQLASNISSRLRSYERYVQQLADTFSRMPDFLRTQDLLDGKREALFLDDLFILNPDGSTFPEGVTVDHFSEWRQGHPHLFSDPSISYIAQQELFFSAPFSTRSGQDLVLVGIQENAKLQQLLREVDFKDHGLCCIIDADGSLIVSPTDMQPFIRLNDIVDDSQGNAFQKVIEDISQRRSGVVSLSSVSGTPMMMAYDFLNINDWILLTLIPQDLLSKGSESYLHGYLIIIALIVLLCGGFLLYLLHTYRTSIQQVEHVALTDILTGGHNTLAFQLQCRQWLAQKPRPDYAVVFLNIRDFKGLNDRFGVAAGDRTLKHIHAALTAHLQRGELAARGDGDRFFLLLKCSQESQVLTRLDAMLTDLERRQGETLLADRSRIAQGAYLVGGDERDILLLQDLARIASTFQQPGEPCRFFDAALKEKMSRAMQLDAAFEDAIRNHEFQVYLQPKVRPDRDQPCGSEALVRWKHPKFGMVYPPEFIPLFEKNGKICDLDFYMFEEICALLHSWMAEGRPIFPISVNLSRAHMGQPDLEFLDRFRQTKEAYAIPDDLIELELTESLLLERRQLELVSEAVAKIRALGFQCSMDDFGFGYSSLALLKDLDLSAIKLDRQFFLAENEKTWLVVNKFIQLAHDLGISVVAEGIEDREQVAQLRRLHCDMIQGYVFAKPLPVPEFLDWCAAYKEEGH